MASGSTGSPGGGGGAMPRRLTRDTQHGVLAGVAAGFGRYLDVDPVLARLGFVLLAFVHGLGILFYLICWLLMPRADAVPQEAAPASPAAGTGFENCATLLPSSRPKSRREFPTRPPPSSRSAPC